MIRIQYPKKRTNLLIIGLLLLTGCATIDIPGLIKQAFKPQVPAEAVAPVDVSRDVKTEGVAEVTVKFKLSTGQMGFFSIDTIEWIKIDDYEYSKYKLLQNDLKILIPLVKNQDSIVKIKLKGFDRPFYIPVVAENQEITKDRLKILAYVNFGSNDREIDSIEVGYAQKDSSDKIDWNKTVFKSTDGQSFKIAQGNQDWTPKTLIKDQPVPEQQSPPPGISMPSVPGAKQVPQQPPAPQEAPNRPYPLPPNPPPLH